MEQQFYWHLTLWDGEIVQVKPQNVENIKERIKNQRDVVTPNRVIAYKNIKDFVESGEMYTDRKLLEDGIRAFGQPEFNADGSVIAKWVKKTIPRREWTKHYMHIPAYKMLNDKDSHIEIAFRLATCDIDPQKVQTVTGHELARLQR